MNTCELATSISTLACAIAANLSDDGLSIVATAITQLGDTLQTIAVQRSFCSNQNSKTAAQDDSCKS